MAVKMSRRMKRNAAILLAAIVALSIILGRAYVQHLEKDVSYEAPEPFDDEPEARARFDAMMSALQSAETLSYESELEWKHGKSRYSAQLGKPNFFRLQVVSPDGKESGAMVGDGENMWIFWAGTRPWFTFEERADYDRTRTKAYMRMEAPPGKHSIKAELSRLTHSMGFPVIDPSFFHMCRDTVLDHVDAMRDIGERRVDGTTCTGVEVSFMESQRSWYLWLSDRDDLPRRLKEVIRAGPNTIITSERYFNFRINEDIEETIFAWNPPADWDEVLLPGPDEMALKPGQMAPEIALESIDGDEIRLSAYRGRVVWLVIWKVGCPPCRLEMPALEELYGECADNGFVVLGVNFVDDKKIARDFLNERKITFPNIVDSSPTAMNVVLGEYSGDVTPSNFIIDTDGRIVDRWHGHDKDDRRGFEITRQLLDDGDMGDQR